MLENHDAMLHVRSRGLSIPLSSRLGLLNDAKRLSPLQDRMHVVATRQASSGSDGIATDGISLPPLVPWTR